MTATLASDAQGNTPQRQSRPTTPAFAGSPTEKRGWVLNAGRRLGITTPKSRRQDGVLENRAVGRPSPDDGASVSKKSEVSFSCSCVTATQVRLLMICKSNETQAQKTVGRLGSNVKTGAFNSHQTSLNRQREHTAPRGVQSDAPHPQCNRSPPDKPLPSLPVATVRPTSPIVRRSLIDASEKPLRKSLSPSPGVEIHEEWPAIQPSSLTSPNTLQGLAQNDSADSATPFMGQEQRRESPTKAPVSPKEKVEYNRPIEATDKGPITSAPVRLRAGLGAANESDTVLAKNEERATEASETYISSIMPDISVGAAEVQGSSYSQRVAPDWRPRQTKTSMMRARLSSSSNNTQGKENKSDGQVASLHQLSPPADPPTANARAIPKPLSIPGPVRSRSRSRRDAPSRNNPYRKGNRVSGGVVESHMNTRGLNASSDCNKPLSSDSGGFPDLMAAKQITASGASTRKSHIPIRKQSKDSEPEENEVDVLVKGSATYVTRKDEDRSFEVAEDADIDSEHKTHSMHCKSVTKSSGISKVKDEDIARELEAVKLRISCSPQQNGSRSATGTQDEIRPCTTTLSSTAFEDNASLSSSSPKNSDIISLQEFITTEPPNYRVKRLSLAAPEHGPTLRIADDAEKVLLGAHSDEEDNVGEDLRAVKAGNAPDLWTAAVLKEQLKVSKERIFKGHLPLTQSTTSRSMSKLDTEQNQLIAAECCVGGARMENINNAIAGSESHGGRPARRMGNEDPFVVDESLALGGHADEPCLPKDQRWPLTCVEATNPDLKTVSERLSDEENSWISPLATSDSQSKDPAVMLTSGGPKNTNATDICGHRQPSDAVPGVQTPMPAQVKKSKDPCGTDSAEGHSRKPFPTRISSRKQFREMIQDMSDQDRPAPRHPSTDPQIPNRFASVRSRNQLNIISTPIAPFTLSENEHRSDLNTAKHGSSSLLRPRRAVINSAKTQPSTTKGMLSNFRGLFHKRSLENTDAVSAMSNGSSVRRKNPIIGKNGSPFPFISNAVSSTPPPPRLLHAKPRLTPTRSGIGSERAADGVSPEFAPPEWGESQRAERLAVQVLDSALLETNTKKRVQLGQVSCKPRLLR
jgi:hypothetical protein